MEPWEILGIPPDSDSRAVRRAYGQRAKSCHPEDDPEGFQRLYEAYQQALRIARWREQRITEDTAHTAPPADSGSGEALPSSGGQGESQPDSPGAPDRSGEESPPDLEILPFLERVLRQQREEVRSIHQIRFAELMSLPNESRAWADYLAGEDFQLVMWDLEFMAGLAALLEDEVLPEAGCEELYYAYDLYQLEDDIRWEQDFRGELYRLLRPVYRRRVELRRLQASALERSKTKLQRLAEKLGVAAIGAIFILLALALCWLVGDIIT